MKTLLALAALLVVAGCFHDDLGPINGPHTGKEEIAGAPGCYLDRYPDVDAWARRQDNPSEAAWEHWQMYGVKERRCYFCDGDPRIEQYTPWCSTAPEPSPTDGGGVGGKKTVGSGFVWKPSSESDGNLVVLFPASFPLSSNVTVGGDPDRIVADYPKRTNNGRPTYRFSKPGAAYPDGVKLTFDGMEWCVKDPGSRYDGSLWACP